MRLTRSLIAIIFVLAFSSAYGGDSCKAVFGSSQNDTVSDSNAAVATGRNSNIGGSIFKAYNKAFLFHKYDQLPAAAYANERKSYTESNPGITLKDGAIIEGSIEHGGIQPHYRVDLSDARLQPFLEFAKELKSKDIAPWEKILSLEQMVKNALPNKSYNSLSYHLLLRKFRNLGRPIGLGDYIDAKSGVCRENALLMHFMLIEAGFNPKFQYWNTWRRLNSSIIYEDHATNTITLNGENIILDSYTNYYNGKKVSDMKKQKENGAEDRGIIKATDYPKILLPSQKNNPTPSLTLKVDENRTLEFEITGRSAAERKFEREEKLIQQSAMEDLVPVEWIFMPSYLPWGHVTLRMGEKLFEFGRLGWKIHDTSFDNARAHLFNNPFTKAAIEKEIPGSLPTFSIAVPMMVKKSTVLEMESRIRSAKDKNTKEFCMITNNCNHQLLELPGFEELSQDQGAFNNFSAVMTFRKILLENPLPTGQPVVYPVPGTDTAATNLREQFPAYLYKPNSMLKEILRLAMNPLRPKKPKSEQPQIR